MKRAYVKEAMEMKLTKEGVYIDGILYNESTTEEVITKLGLSDKSDIEAVEITYGFWLYMQKQEDNHAGSGDHHSN